LRTDRSPKRANAGPDKPRCSDRLQIAPRGATAIALALLCDALTQDASALTPIVGERDLRLLIDETLQSRPSPSSINDRLNPIIASLELHEQVDDALSPITLRLKKLRLRLAEALASDHPDAPRLMIPNETPTHKRYPEYVSPRAAVSGSPL
jgi:hypothetical protein